MKSVLHIKRTEDSLDLAYQIIIAGNRDEEENRILKFLENSFPDLVAHYLFSIPKGRQGILNRLAGSLLREDVLGLFSQSYDLQMIDSIVALNVPKIDGYWRRIIQTLHRSGLASAHSYKVYPLSDQEALVIPVSRTYAFRRTEIPGAILYIHSMQVRQVEHPVELLQLIRRKEALSLGEETGSWIRLADELRNGCANLALAYSFWIQKKHRIQSQAEEIGEQNSLDLALGLQRKNSGFDPYLFFEQLCSEGHNLHPGAKTKMGMEPQDVYQFAPEFGNEVAIRFVGIKREHAGWATSERAEANKLFFEAFPALVQAVEKEFAAKGLTANDYVFVPVHAWQWEHALGDIYREELSKGVVVPVESFSVPCLATSSFRTVVPISRGGRASSGRKDSGKQPNDFDRPIHLCQHDQERSSIYRNDKKNHGTGTSAV